MFLYFWCLLSLTLAALLMGTSFAHVLEMPAKLRYDGPLWLQVQHSLYRAYGGIDAAIEAAAIIAAAFLAFFLRDWRPSLLAALAGTVCLAIAFLFVRVMIINPVNARTANWTRDTLPADWERWRRRWEVSHAVRFVLHLSGFVLLVLATLVSPLSDD
jgi:Domain of unknown function (DUF1772)